MTITTTKDTSKAIQFCTRKEAATAAKRIGWKANDVEAVEIMGFHLWLIMDDHCSYVTRHSYLQFAKEITS